jgi:hypothetical protein
MLERPKFKIKKLTKHRRKKLFKNSLSTLPFKYPRSEPVFGNVEGAQSPAYVARRAGTTTTTNLFLGIDFWFP